MLSKSCMQVSEINASETNLVAACCHRWIYAFLIHPSPAKVLRALRHRGMDARDSDVAFEMQ